MRTMSRVAVQVVACVLGVATLANCSSSDDDSAESAPPASPDVTPPAVIESAQDIVDYYVALGTTEPVAVCFSEVLTELGITDMAMLEDQQDLGEEAADRFAVCTSTGGERSTEG